jgi:hypothetical protein
MALSADRDYSVAGLTEILHVKLTASVAYYKGGMLQWDATTGAAKKAAADVAGEFGFGVLKKGYASSAAVQDAEVETGKVWIPFASAAQTDVGDWVYCTDDAVITKSALTNGGPCGRAVDFKTGYLLVDFRSGGPKTLSA